MKHLFAFLFVSLCATQLSAQSKNPGSMKKLVGQSYLDARHIQGLKGWQFRQGDLITPVDDSEMVTVDVYVKGTSAIVILSVMEDTASRVFHIADVLEIKNVPKGWVIKTSTCSEGDNEDIELVALVKETKSERFKLIKQAWRCNRAKRRIEIASIKNISCINDGMEQY
jgi:hypothetical protein